MITRKLKLTLTCLLCLPAMQAMAHDGIKYDCSSDGITRMVEFFDDENRVQINIGNDSYGTISDGKGAFLNNFEQTRFYPKDNASLLFLSDKKIICSNFGATKYPNGETYYDNASGMSLGGSLRDGPGTEFPKIGSLAEGSPVNINANTGVNFNGYDWFKISNGTSISYQWGGIMCSNLVKLEGIYEQCK